MFWSKSIPLQKHRPTLSIGQDSCGVLPVLHRHVCLYIKPFFFLIFHVFFHVPKITHSNAKAVCVCNKKNSKEKVVTCLGSFICAYQTDFDVFAVHAQQFLISFSEININ